MGELLKKKKPANVFSYLNWLRASLVYKSGAPQKSLSLTLFLSLTLILLSHILYTPCSEPLL